MSTIHYCVADADTKEPLYDGHAPEAPSVGDQIEIIEDGEAVVRTVTQRLWQQAGTVLGDETARAGGHASNDLCCVVLYTKETIG